ncbi:MAG: hypothetical protein ACK5MQ_04020 [Pikeienuella sp.]
MTLFRKMPAFACLLAVSVAAPALAQTGEPPAESVTIGGRVGGPDTDPFLAPGSVPSRQDRARNAPRDENYGYRGYSARNDMDFDSLLTPGARGSKRSMPGRGTDLPLSGD